MEDMGLTKVKNMSLQKALNKTMELFPIGSKVGFKGTFCAGYKEGEGEVVGYRSDFFIWIIVESLTGNKEFNIVDPEDEYFEYDKDSVWLIE